MASNAAVDKWIVREDGVGPVKIGRKLSELNANLNEKFAIPESNGDPSCFNVKPKKQPGVAFLIIDGPLARVGVSGPGVRTTAGIQVVDSQEHALQVYTNTMTLENHKYLESGRYLTVKSRGGQYGNRFETNGKKITMYYAGRFEAIRSVEGCG